VESVVCPSCDDEHKTLYLPGREVDEDEHDTHVEWKHPEATAEAICNAVNWEYFKRAIGAIE